MDSAESWQLELDAGPGPERGGCSSSRILRELSALPGGELKYAAVARGLGLSRLGLLSRIEELEGQGALRLLHPLGLPADRRMLRNPVVHLREAGAAEAGLVLPPELRYRSEMIEHLLARERARCPTTRSGYCAARTAAHPALVFSTPRANIGFEFPYGDHPGRRCWTGVKKGVRDGALDFGFVVYPGNRAFFGAPGIVAVPDGELLAEYCPWLDAAEEAVPELARRRWAGKLHGLVQDCDGATGLCRNTGAGWSRPSTQ